MSCGKPCRINDFWLYINIVYVVVDGVKDTGFIMMEEICDVCLCVIIVVVVVVVVVPVVVSAVVVIPLTSYVAFSFSESLGLRPTAIVYTFF